MDDSCAVCAESLEWVAYGPCGHREVCSTCVARLRFICDDRRCCICKTESNQVFVTKALGDYTKVINDFSVLPAELKEGRVGPYWYHEDTQAVFDDLDHYKMIQAMCKLSCSVCDTDEGDGPRRRIRFKNVEQLKGHLYHQHRLVMCSLCLEGRKVFICEQKLYTRSQLNRHINSGDSEVDGTESERGGFMGHPMCEFCKTPFYGDNELYSHMSTEHYTCHICQRQHPGQYEYYKNYDDLEIHFRRDHFLCEDEACLAKKFVVFQSEAEMKRHNALEHGGNMSRSKRIAALQIPTSFRYQRSNEQDHRQGRRRSFRRDIPEDQLSMAIQASYETAANAGGVTGNNNSSSSTQQTVSGRGERVDVDPIVQPLELPATSDSDQPTRYRQALSLHSSTGPLEESSFPPLPVAPPRGGNQQNPKPETQRNTMAANLRRKNNSSATSKQAQAWPAVNRTPIMPAAAASPVNAWPTASGSSSSSSSSSSGQKKPAATNNGPSASSYPSLARPQPASSSHGAAALGSSSSSSSSSSGQKKPAATNNGPAGSNFPSLARAQPAASSHGAAALGSSSSSSSSGQSKQETNNGPAASSYSSLARAQPASSHGDSSGARRKGNTNNKMNHSTSAPNLADITSFDPSTSDFPPVSVTQVRKLSTSSSAQGVVPKVGDVHSANKSLVERIRTALEFDESKYTEFKEISGKYRQGLMDAESYLAYVYQYGLSHLVIELARLCPDIDKQKELIDTYNYNAQILGGSGNSGRKNKGGGGGGNHTRGGGGDSGMKKGKGKGLAEEEDNNHNHSKMKLADSIINSVRNLQSSYKFADEEVVEILSKDGYRDGKGKSKVIVVDEEQEGKMSYSGGEPSLKQLQGKYESHSDGGGVVSNQSLGGNGKSKQQRKKTSKFHRVRLGDGSVAALLDLKNSNFDEDAAAAAASSDGKKNEGGGGGGLPVRGVWRNGGGHKLMGKTAGESK